MKPAIEVASFWHGAPLTFFEIVCIQSFLDHGYTFHLYSLEPLDNVPDGVICHDARDICPADMPKSADNRYNGGVYSDIFRLYLMQRTDQMWVDLDIYSVRPIDFQRDYYFGRHPRRPYINNCLLRLPPNSPALRLMLNFVESECPFPPWWSEETLRPLFDAYRAGKPVGIGALPWMTTGPRLLSWAAALTGEAEKGQPWRKYYQYIALPSPVYLDPDIPTEQHEAPKYHTIHLIGATKIRMRDFHDGLPPEGSYMDTNCKRHNIDPMEFPLTDHTTRAIVRTDPTDL